MISYENWEIIVSVLFYCFTKFLCIISECYQAEMYDKHSTLSSIPEWNETEEELKPKWIPKKKHDVLKMKYKCLKKLFQVYDASMIGAMPEAYDDYQEEEKPKRKKRSHRTKTLSTSDITQDLDPTESYVSMHDSNSGEDLSGPEKLRRSCSTQKTETTEKCVQDTKFDTSLQSSERSSNFDYAFSEPTPDSPYVTVNHRPMNYMNPGPYFITNEKRKRTTRFQSFLQRLFGIYPENDCGNFYSASDNDIVHYRTERRRRRGLRFRKKTKKSQSEGSVRGMRSPEILSYVQSVQLSCLTDTTPRTCPMVGCNMTLNGIINYNDHLNLCHFSERKFICHYCHVGFDSEHFKNVHENEHIGITQLNAVSTSRSDTKKIAQTESASAMAACNVSDEKLKKLVSFFDKIVNDDNPSAMNKNRHSETNLQSLHDQASRRYNPNKTYDTVSVSSDKRTSSCGNLSVHRSHLSNCDVMSKHSVGSVRCAVCGDSFENRRQLMIHTDLEHRPADRFSKFNSCIGLTSPRQAKPDKCIASANATPSAKNSSKRNKRQSSGNMIIRPSEGTVSCNSSNITCYDSEASIDCSKKSSVMSTIVQRVRSSKIPSYNWEPSSRIIRV